MNAQQTKRRIWLVNFLLLVAVMALVWLLSPLIDITPTAQPPEIGEMVPASARAVEVIVDGIVVGSFAVPPPPQQVELAGKSYRVVPFRDDVPALAADEIGWLEGTIINHAFFLGESAETDSISVQLDAATTLNFASITTGTCDALEDIIQQQQPAVTILSEGNVLLHGLYYP